MIFVSGKNSIGSFEVRGNQYFMWNKKLNNKCMFNIFSSSRRTYSIKICERIKIIKTFSGYYKNKNQHDLSHQIYVYCIYKLCQIKIPDINNNLKIIWKLFKIETIYCCFLFWILILLYNRRVTPLVNWNIPAFFTVIYRCMIKNFFNSIKYSWVYAIPNV